VEGYADRGIGRYVAGYAGALARAGRLTAALLAPELPPPSGLPEVLIDDRLLRWDCRAEAKRIVASGGPLAYHVTAPFLHCGPLDPPVLGVVPHWSTVGLPRVCTLHDLIPLRAPNHYLPSDAYLERYRARARWVAESDLIVTNSAYTRCEAIELLQIPEAKVVEVGAGVSGFFSPADGTDDELWKLRLPQVADRPFLLTVGGSDWRKGTDRVIAALGRLARRDRDLMLLVAGDLTGPWLAQLTETSRAQGVADRVVFLGSISDELLRACYRRATATVMASLAEGAGLPVLESAMSGCPALASDNSALAETAAISLALFDPTDTDSLVASITALLDDQARRDRILAAQQEMASRSSWDAVAARAAAAFDGLPEPEGRVSRPWPAPARALALVGPLTPDGGGIGAYNCRLLAAVGPDVDLRVDAVSPSPARPDLPEHVGYVAADAFGLDARPCSYDQVVYTLGNSDGHLATIGLALAHPGWVWLHEARLPAVATTALGDESEADFERAMSGLLHRAYPGRPPVAAARQAGRSHIELVAAGVGLLGPLVERCRGVLVNSRLAAYMVEMDLAPLAWRPPILVLPPACPPVRPRDDRDRGHQVVALGVVSASKRPDLLVDAAVHGGWRLAFVGPCPPVLRQYIEERAARRGVSGAVEVVGEVGDGEWAEWLDRAELAVQLRGSRTGETSAAVLEALSSGVPVLTNLATAAEYPVGTCALIAEPTPATLGRAVEELIASPEHLRGLSRAGQTFASAHQFSDLLSALLAATDQALPS
jgi:glycosyltransferase involved in cell wall biosynthesis